MNNPRKLSSDQAKEFEGASIVDIVRGEGERRKYVYACIKSKDGKLLVSGSLDYCCKRMKDATKHF